MKFSSVYFDDDFLDDISSKIKNSMDSSNKGKVSIDISGIDSDHYDDLIKELKSRLNTELIGIVCDLDHKCTMDIYFGEEVKNFQTYDQLIEHKTKASIFLCGCAAMIILFLIFYFCL